MEEIIKQEASSILSQSPIKKMSRYELFLHIKDQIVKKREFKEEEK